MNSFEVRGVIEGFYGRPYSFAERERMIDFMGQHGFTMYVYAPKNDPIHRNRWREPYLPEELERFGALARQCGRQGMEFVFGVSPLQFHYTNQADLELLWQKLLCMYRLGIRSFTLLLDDMPDTFHHKADAERFDSVAGAQVWLVNSIWERFLAAGGVKRFIFCPTEYCGEGVSAYLTALGEGLQPEVDLFWTGTEVCAQFLRTEDAQRVSATLKRPVLYWDNYPVNDLDMRFRPHIRPIRGRDADLGGACRGIVANCSLQPEVAKIPLYTYARYFADPAGYEPESAWREALLLVTGNPGDAEAVSVLGDLCRWSALERGRPLHNRLAPELARFWQRWGGAPAEAGPDLADAPPEPPGQAEAGTAAEREAAIRGLQHELARLKAVAARLQTGMANPYLQAELRPWADKLAGWVDTGMLALSVLSRSLHHPADPEIPGMRQAVLAALLTCRENFHWVCGDLIDQFSRRCLWAAQRLQTGA